MTIETITDITGTGVYFQKWTIWDPTITAYSNNYIVQRSVKEDNDTISRSKPIGNLIENMTALPLQSKSLNVAGEFTRDSHPRWYKTYRTTSRALCDDRLLVNCAPPHWETKLRLKVKAEAINLGESLAEYRQTANMFVTFVQKFAWGLKKLRRGQLPFNRRINLNDVASGHLMYAFGIAPLAGDLADSIGRLTRKLEANAYRRYAVQVKNEETLDGIPTSSGWLKDGSRKRSIHAVAYVRFNKNPSNFTLGNPLELAWELTPFSWLVDYAFNIGDYLSSLDALMDVDSVKGFYTEKQEYSISTDYGKSANENTVSFTNATYKYESHVRVALDTIPLGRLEYKPSLSFGKVINALAVFKVITNKRY